MKVLLLHNDYQQAGGERTAVESLAGLLRKSGCGVVPYVRDNAEISEYSIVDKVRFIPSTVYSQRTVSDLRRLASIEQPDVAHVHNVFPLISPSAYRFLHRAGIPIVQTVHNFRFMCANGYFFTQGKVCERCKQGNTLHAVRFRCYRNSRLLSALYAFTLALHRRWGTFDLIDHFITLSHFTARKLIEAGLAGPGKITVLPNFIPSPLPRPGRFDRREPYVVFLGRLTEEKGVWTALQAISAVPQLRLKVAGSGPLAPAVKDYVAGHQFSNVDVLGYVSGEEKWELLRSALAVIVPSHLYENLPFAALEALAVGTPAIVSNMGSLPEVIDDGRAGLIFRPADPEDLRAKLTWLASHPDQSAEMGRRGREIVEQTHSESSHIQALFTIYRGSLSEKRA